MSQADIFQQEQQHLSDIFSLIVAQEAQAQEALSSVKAKQKEVYAEDDAYVSSNPEAMASIQQQKSVFEDLYRKIEHLQKKYEQLTQLHKQAYFGRIDLVETDFPEDKEQIYIGNYSFITDDHDIKIYDWRAPICSVFYQSNVGRGSYESPQGKIDVDLQLKRTFMMNGEHLQQVFDVEDEDTLLANVLSQKNEAYMKPIVATIQAKQNEIIRDVTHRNILVQGVAGSGKTAILLQRISYLLYPQEKQVSADQILLFSPNPYFSAYISHVLPELGEKQLNQMTLKQFLTQLTEIDLVQQPENEQIAKLKSQPEMLTTLTDYLDHLTAETLFFKDITIEDEVIVKASEIQKMFGKTDTDLTIFQQITVVKEMLITLVQKRLEKLQTSEKLEQEIQNLSDTQYNLLLNNKVFQSYEDETKYLAKRLKKRIVNHFLQKTNYAQFVDFSRQYIDFLINLGTADYLKVEKIDKKDWQNMLDSLTKQLTEDYEANEADAALLLYLQASLFDQDVPPFQHIMIDEVQNFSTNLLLYLRKLYPKVRFTLVGDENQTAETTYANIYQSGETIRNLFGIDMYYELNISYRATRQITEFSKEILATAPNIEAFDRDGKLPTVSLTKDLTESFQKTLAFLQQDTSSNVAIISKDQETAEQFAQFCEKNDFNDFTLIELGQKTQPARIMILSSDTAKGVEYDKVVLLDATAENYHTKETQLLLYTLATRAKHELILFADTALSPFIEKVSDTLYTRN